MSEFTTAVRHLTFPERPLRCGDRLYFSDCLTNQVLSASAAAEVRHEAVAHAALGDVVPHRLDDMAVDAEGRAYVGNRGSTSGAAGRRPRRATGGSAPTAPSRRWPRT